MTDSRLDSIRQLYPSLAGLPAELDRALLAQARPVHLPAGTIVFDRGSPCQDLPLISRGSVRIVRRAPNGRDFLLYRLGPGELCVLTTAALLGDVTYDATGIVEQDLSAELVPKPLVLDLVERHPPFRRAAFEVFAARFSHLMLLVEQVAIARLDQRLADLLVRRGPVVMATHQALADELATVREVVSRILESFEVNGLVRLQRGRVDVLSVEGLQLFSRSQTAQG